MTTRYDADSNGGLKSGYEKNNFSTLTLPACGIEDVDRALFNLFDKELRLSVQSQSEITAVKTIFATGEKWAMVKKRKEIRDNNGRLILPLITVGRTEVEQDIHNDITGRGINQQTGELVIKRRISSYDRSYQNLINRLYVRNQSNVAVNKGDLDYNVNEQLMTSRVIGDLQDEDLDIADGALLKPVKNDNVWETVTIPTPQFFTAHYEVVVWTQYTSHMNQILEALVSAQLPQGNAYRVSNPINPGYWFIAQVDDCHFKPNNNWDDMFEKDRIIKYDFNMSVKGYVLASDTPGAPVPIRRYISSPRIEFKTENTDDLANVSVNVNEKGAVEEPWLGADDPTLPYDHENPSRLQREDARLTDENVLDNIAKLGKNDLAKRAIKRGESVPKYMRVKSVDAHGNTQYRNVKLKNVNKYTGESTIDVSDFQLNGITFIIDD